jgi:hypothetical protein
MTANGLCELIVSIALAAPGAIVTSYARRNVRR